MSFAFERDDANVEQGLRRIAVEQIDKALLEASAPTAEFDRTVHQLRRRCKNLRGLLRIVEPGLNVFNTEDAAVRTVALRLSQTRDAAVAVQTFDALLKDAAIDGIDRQGLRDMLVERGQGVALQLDQRGLLAEFSQAMLAMRPRAAGWTLEHRKFAGLEGGIADTYRRLRRRMRVAADDGSPVNLHAWRKQAKYHRHHVMLLRRHAPDVLEGRSKLLAELADLLGDHHDLAVLVEVLTARAGGASAGLTVISELAERRQGELSAQAFALGGQIAAEKPRDLIKRLRRYWALQEA